MKEKLTTAAKAAEMILPGTHLGVGAGMSNNRMPVIREVKTRGVSDLTLTPELTGEGPSAAPRTQRMLAEGRDVHVYFDNDALGRAPFESVFRASHSRRSPPS